MMPKGPTERSAPSIWRAENMTPQRRAGDRVKGSGEAMGK